MYVFYYILFCWIVVTGTLKGYDQLLNLILDDAKAQAVHSTEAMEPDRGAHQD